jgi:hypothetical protein
MEVDVITVGLGHLGAPGSSFRDVGGTAVGTLARTAAASSED